MNSDKYWKMKPEDLKDLYLKESQRLNESLLAGADWASVKDQSDLVCDLAKILDRRLGGMHEDPSMSNLRKAN
jgi:hypothetical protein